MARTSKAKKTQEAAVPMNVEIFEALRQLEKERGIPVDYMVDRIKQALVNAYRKDREDGNKEAAAENVVVELTESAMSMVQRKVVVEEVEEPTEEIALDAARKYDPNAKVGDTISIPINIEGFGRIAAQTAKQVIIQGIREAERGAMADSYSSRVQEIFTGTVVRILPETGDMIVVDAIKTEEYKTKTMANMLKALGSDKKALVVLADNDAKVVKSMANIPGVKTALVNTVNVYDVLNCDKFIVVKSAAEKMEEVYA